MSHRFRIPVRSRLAINKISQTLKRLRARLLSDQGGSVTDAFSGIFHLMEKVLPRLGKPTFSPTYLVWDADPDPELWNLNLERIEEDLTNLFAEVDELRELRMETSHAASLAGQELTEKANLAQSMITDLRLTSGQLGQEVLVASDDFRNLDKVDLGFPTQYPQAEVNVVQGVVSLQRIETTNVATPDATVDVTPILPSDLARLPTPENVLRFYEGRFYAPLGQSRPEGGSFHLEERVKPGVTVPGDSIVYAIDNTRGENIFDDFPDLRKAAEDRPQGFPLSPEDIVVLDRGASLVELQEARKKMLDSDAESFWECEFVINANALDELVAKREAEEVSVTPQELRALAASSAIDAYDFGVEIVIKLGRRQMINFITINPMNFSETAWIEITDISIASDETDAFVPIEGFGDQIFENVLTDRANSELGETEQGATMARTPFVYRGQGVYSFPPRQASRVRIRLKQRTPVPSEHERVAIQLTRTLTSTETSSHGSCFPGDAMVCVPHGRKRISDLKVGDEVISYSKAKQKVSHRKITKMLVHDFEQLYKVHFTTGSLRATGNHTILTRRGWKQVKDLTTEDLVVGLRPGLEFQEKVRGITLDTIEHVYNLHTAGEHNFIVEGCVVHNFTFMRRIRTIWHRLFVDGRK